MRGLAWQLLNFTEDLVVFVDELLRLVGRFFGLYFSHCFIGFIDKCYKVSLLYIHILIHVCIHPRSTQKIIAIAGISNICLNISQCPQEVHSISASPDLLIPLLIPLLTPSLIPLLIHSLIFLLIPWLNFFP